MAKKKQPAEKYTRISISIDPRLYATVTETARYHGITVSGLVSELLTGWINGTYILSPDEKHNSSIESRLNRIETIIQSLIYTDNTGIDRPREMDPVHDGDPVDGAAMISVYTSNTDADQDQDPDQERSTHTGSTGIYWQRVFSRYAELKTRYTVKQISEYTGIPEGTLKKLSPGQKAEPLKNPLHEDRYRRLMEM